MYSAPVIYWQTFSVWLTFVGIILTIGGATAMQTRLFQISAKTKFLDIPWLMALGSFFIGVLLTATLVLELFGYTFLDPVRMTFEHLLTIG